METLFKEKSWSVKLVDGFVSDSKVRAPQCVGCSSASSLVVLKSGNPNMVLYGCSGSKCQHRLIKVQFRQTIDRARL